MIRSFYSATLVALALLGSGGPVKLLAQTNGVPPLTRTSEQTSEASPTPAPTAEPVAPTAEEAKTSVINSAANDYVLTAADTLEMSVFHEPDLETRSRIGSDGTVQLPLIGDVKVAGMTVRDARELIRKNYDAKFLVNPQVYLNVVDYAQRKFTILGQVFKPGTYEIPGGSSLNLLEAVGIAGGFTRSADKGKVVVQRAGESSVKKAVKVNAKKVGAGGGDGFEVHPGDVITVPESWF